MSGLTSPIDERVYKFLWVQKENLYIVQELKKTGKVPETHEEYLHYMDRALETLTNLGHLKIEMEDDPPTLRDTGHTDPPSLR